MTNSNLGFALCGYRVSEELFRAPKTVVYRAELIEPKLASQPESVVIKLLTAAYPTDRELLNFRHQYTILQGRGSSRGKNLDLPGVVEIYSLEASDRGYALVMEDFGGVSLVSYRQNKCLPLVDVLKIAIQLADTLHALGQARIVHKDLKPANILINPTTQQVKLTDFGIASLLPREYLELQSPSWLEGTLAYLAPEQTGRMNRGIDYRTDFYGLGVTLAELLTGKLPFEAADPLDLIHFHLEREAVRIDVVNPDLPAIVAEIVAKLMAKQAEDRYQSALGLKYDLEQCLQQWQTTGAIVAFELAQRDASDRFTIPERLYGRELAVKNLLATCDRVAAGGSELVLVAGCSGIGKTALINEIHKPITRQHGYFIKGKFDQFNRNIPLWGFVQALRDLITQLASEGDDRLATWKSKILAAVGVNGQVLIDAIPELERIIGAQPTAVELAPADAQQRFSGLFQKLIAVFTTRAHPLTIFLDDLQWADAASLESIELLMAGTGYLLILGAYRDNEVAPMHLLMLTIERLQQAHKPIGTISLAPLTFDDTARLVADTLRCPRLSTQPLTELIFLKTAGNPFFTTQFLKALYDAGEIWFNAQGNWECDIARIQALALSDDIVEFMAAQLQKLPPPTQQLLKLAACIGNSFDLQTLEIVAEQSRSSVETLLWSGLEAGLILPRQLYKFAPESVDRAPTPLRPPNFTYRFLHDRVQQAAYSLIPEQQQQTHLQIGRLLLANTRSQPQLENLFESVSHLNKAIALVEEPAERALLAQLNLQAAGKARAANAYGAAFSYARIGTEILGESGWTQQYPLTLALYETLADAAFLSGDFESVPGLVQIVLDSAQTPLDRAKSYETMIRYHGIKKQYQQAIASGIAILQQLGIKIPPKPDRLTLLRELVKTKIALMGKSNEQLLALPEIVDPEKIARLNILNLLQFSAFFCSQELMAVVSFVSIRLTLRDGNTPWVASFYATYCIVISSLGELKQTYRIAQLAIMLADRYANLAVTGRVKVIAPWYALPWQEPLRGTIPMLDESVRLAIEGGDLQYIGINAGVAIATRFYAGIPLDEVVDCIDAAAALIVQSKDENSQQFFDLMRQTIVNLHTPSDRPTDIFQEKDRLSLVSQWQSKNEAILLSTMYGFQTLLAYHFEDIPNALISADAQLPYEYSAKGGYSIARIWLFDALTRLAAYPHSNKRVQKKLLKRIDESQRQLGKRARSMPGNFQHQHDLVAAEKCRVLGNFIQAIELYDRAIAGAKANAFCQEEALANELAAKFYLAWGKAKIAAIYLQAAYYGYVLWGAKAKTADLERRYPQLLAPILAAQQAEVNALATLTQITSDAAIPPIERQSATSFDLATTIQAAQTLASTIELTELIHQLSEILLQNSGAQTCILVLPDDDPERWLIRAQSVVAVGTQATTTQLSQPLADGFDYPANLIYSIKNTQQAAIFDARQPLTIPDSYLLEHQPASVFCLPIVKQERILGVVYLEHRHTPAIFTQQHQTVIAFLCHQAAIALDNANLYRQAQTATANLQRQQSYLAALLDNIPHRTWIKDREARFIAVNQSFGALLDRAPHEFVGKTDFDVWPRELAQQYHTEHLLTMASGQCQIVEELVEYPLGVSRWLETCKTPVRDSDGRITGTVGIALDITERKSMEISLRESQERYHQLVSNVPGALYQFELKADGTGQLNYISARCTELFEISPAAAVADLSSLLDRILPADRQSFDRSIHQATQLGNSWHWEGRIATPSGQIKWIRGESRHQPTGDGTIVWDGILTDVTDRKRTEIALSQSQARYQKLAANIPGIIYQFRLAPDGSRNYPYVSSGCWDLLEISPAAVMADAQCAIDLIHPDDRPAVKQVMAQSARDLAPLLWEGRMLLHSGVIKWIKYAARPELQADGAIVWDGIMLDITALKAAQQDRHRQEAALNAIGAWTATGKSGLEFYQACTQYIVQNFDVRYAFVSQPTLDNPTSKAQIGVMWTGTEFLAPYQINLADTPCGVTYQNDWGIFPKDLQAHFPKATQLASLQGESYLSVAIRDADGKMLGNLGIIDIKPLPADLAALQFILQLFADRIAAEIVHQADEAELRKRQQQIEAFINNSPAAMYLKDLDGRYRLVNQTFINLAGSDAHLLLGETDAAIYPPEIANQISERDRATIRAGESMTIEEVAIDLHGVERTYISNKFVLIDEAGKPYALGGVSTDITDRKQAEAKLSQTNQRLESTNQELQRATRLKDEFLATMSHELRTPLNAILGMSEALQDAEVFGALDERQLNAIATISQSGEHLLALINDILDVSKISAGKLELNVDRVCLTELCKSSLLLVKPQALAKQIQLETQLAVSPDWIAVDERRMRQVLINLLNNAVKFTPPGGRVKLSVSVAAADVCDITTGACLCFSVSDTGIGISDADRAKLFQPFVQIDSSLNRKYSGSGLGLVLVKQIVELHGGTVTIASEVNKGSCFSVLLPQDCWQLKSTQIAATSYYQDGAVTLQILPPRPVPTILLAEGSEVIIDTFANYFTAKGYRVILAQTAPAAIDLAGSHTPDLILLDLQLASEDKDLTLADLCRAPTPVIVMTAGFSTQERDNWLQLGAAAYLTKPIKLMELHQLIQDCLYLN
jgi:PAS domain S-box-containing protein